MSRLGRIILVLLMAFVFRIPLLHEEALGQSKQKPSLTHEVRKDPFSLPPGIGPFSKEVKAKEEKITPIKTETARVDTPMRLKAILISDHVRLASIDQVIVTIGDSIHAEKVREIRPDRVVLEKEGRKRTLLLEQSPVKLTVE